MAWIPFYANGADWTLVLDRLNSDPEITFVVAREPEVWVAKSALEDLEPRRYALWHLGSGPDLFQGAAEWKEPASSHDKDNLY